MTDRRATAARLVALGTATLGESGARPLPPGLVARWPGAAVAGPALTVRCGAGDNLALHRALPSARSGEVLCVVTDGDPARGYWGEVLTVAAQMRGVAGLVLDGGVRDLDAIEARRFPVFSSSVALPGATKTAPGTQREPISMLGVTVAPGDWVVADRDGVVVIDASLVDEAVDAATLRAERERELFRALESGATTIDLLGL